MTDAPHQRDLLVDLRSRAAQALQVVQWQAQEARKALMQDDDYADPADAIDFDKALMHVQSGRTASSQADLLLACIKEIEDKILTDPRDGDVVNGWTWGADPGGDAHGAMAGWWKGATLIWQEPDRMEPALERTVQCWKHTGCGEDYKGGLSAAEVMRYLDRRTD